MYAWDTDLLLEMAISITWSSSLITVNVFKLFALKYLIHFCWWRSEFWCSVALLRAKNGLLVLGMLWKGRPFTVWKLQANDVSVSVSKVDLEGTQPSSFVVIWATYCSLCGDLVMLKEAFAHRAPRFLLLNSFLENLLSLDLGAEPTGWFPCFVLCQHLENLKSSKEKKNLQQSLRRRLKAQALPFPHLTGFPSRWSRPPAK